MLYKLDVNLGRGYFSINGNLYPIGSVFVIHDDDTQMITIRCLFGQQQKFVEALPSHFRDFHGAPFSDYVTLKNYIINNFFKHL